MCPALTAPMNGQVSYDMTSPYGIGTVARFTCDTGFSLNGAVDMLTCADDDQLDTVGTWGGTEPTCPRESIIIKRWGLMFSNTSCSNFLQQSCVLL